MITKKQMEEAEAGIVAALNDPVGTKRSKKLLRRMKAIVGISSDALHVAHSSASRVTNVAKKIDASLKAQEKENELARDRHRTNVETISMHGTEIDSMLGTIEELNVVIAGMREQMEEVVSEFVGFTKEVNATFAEFAKIRASE